MLLFQSQGDISRLAVFIIPHGTGCSLLSWQDFIPVGSLQALSKHLIGTIGALIVFWITTSLAALLFPKYDYIIGRVEVLGLILLLCILVYRLLKDRLKGGSNVPILAA